MSLLYFHLMLLFQCDDSLPVLDKYCSDLSLFLSHNTHMPLYSHTCFQKYVCINDHIRLLAITGFTVTLTSCARIQNKSAATCVSERPNIFSSVSPLNKLSLVI